MRQCMNCSRPLGSELPTAPHKKFCSSSCRNEYHSRRRRQGRNLLTQIEKLTEEIDNDSPLNTERVNDLT